MVSANKQRKVGKGAGIMEVTKSLRYRINVSTSVKGIKTWDCTVDGENYTMNEVLSKSDEVVRELEKRYPFNLEEK